MNAHIEHELICIGISLCLKADTLLGELVSDVSIKGRYKSRYNTMKKLLKAGYHCSILSPLRTASSLLCFESIKTS